MLGAVADTMERAGPMCLSPMVHNAQELVLVFHTEPNSPPEFHIQVEEKGVLFGSRESRAHTEKDTVCTERKRPSSISYVHPNQAWAILFQQ